jgi:hypothetical protein
VLYKTGDVVQVKKFGFMKGFIGHIVALHASTHSVRYAVQFANPEREPVWFEESELSRASEARAS